ncbi:MAG: hypothetical protein JKY62_16725 [Desulfocapsa sp.]|nr:hypothetical protein [Desulfocapsa sp.]
MANKTLTQILASNPVTAALTGEEPIETVVSSTSEAAKLKQLSFAPINAIATTGYTLDLEDQGRIIAMSNASANTVTIPLNASEAFPIGATLIVRQVGAGITSIAAIGGVTLQIRATLTQNIAEKWGQIVLHKVAVDTWHTAGEYLSA